MDEPLVPELCQCGKPPTVFVTELERWVECPSCGMRTAVAFGASGLNRAIEIWNNRPVFDELKEKYEKTSFEQRNDYADARKFQGRFIMADQRRRYLTETVKYYADPNSYVDGRPREGNNPAVVALAEDAKYYE